MTAVPFGYLLVALVFCAFLVVGAWLAIRGWSRKKYAQCLAGLLLLAGVIGLVAAQLVFEDSMEWNPIFADDARIVGTWKDKRETVILRADHTGDYTSDSKKLSGTWVRNDLNLYLTTKDAVVTMRFISIRDRLRLMTSPPENIDMWDGKLGLARE